MSKRLQVLIEPGEYRSFQQMARDAGVSLGEWVRQALRRLSMEKSIGSPKEKLEAVRRYSSLNAPTCDVAQMLAEIEKGRLGE